MTADQDEKPRMPLLSGVGRLAARVTRSVYPAICCGCGIIVSRHAALCPSCWSTLPLIEKPYCDILGLPFSHDQGPGALSPQAIAEPPVFDRLRAVAAHDGVARRLVHALKYKDRPDLAIMMASWMIRASDGLVASCDAIVPVPLHAFRLWGRKFNQSAELARAIGRISGKPYLPDALTRRRHTAHQVGLGARARADNVRGAFQVAAGAAPSLFGARVLLIDDVYTTGATVSAATRALKRAGAAHVAVLTFARVVAAPI